MKVSEAMSDWSKPQELDTPRVVFPASVKDLMPPYAEIPEEFKDWNNRTAWGRIQSQWFYSGFDEKPLVAKDGIDKTTALNHLQAIQGSWEPRHEHKMAAVAYLMSLWFKQPSAKQMVQMCPPRP